MESFHPKNIKILIISNLLNISWSAILNRLILEWEQLCDIFAYVSMLT